MNAVTSSQLTADEVFGILSSDRRRMVLSYLREHGPSGTMDELAEQIAAWENDVAIDELTSQQRKRVYVSLYQTHLPKLAEAEIVDYDVDEGTVQLTELATEIDAFLTPQRASGYPWRLHYLVLIVGGGALMAFGALATSVIGSLVLIWIAAGIIAGCVVTVIAQYWYCRRERVSVPVELTPP
jgi:DNA-binding transcriptional ArsR family regulator